jgi:hypothetical protein
MTNSIMAQQLTIPYRAHLCVGEFKGKPEDGYIIMPVENYGHIAGKITHLIVQATSRHGDGTEFHECSGEKKIDQTIGDVTPGKSGLFHLTVILPTEAHGADQVIIMGSIDYETGFPKGTDRLIFIRTYEREKSAWIRAAFAGDIDLRGTTKTGHAEQHPN